MPSRATRKSLRRHVASILCAILSASSGAAGTVHWNLCVADDGHSTIEVSHGDSDCWTEVRRHHAGTTALDRTELGRHSCTDIPIVEAGAGHTSGHRFSLEWLPASSCRGVGCATVRRSLADRSDVDPRIAQVLRWQRTVVLIV